MPERRDTAIANGILILSNYMKTGYHVCAEHDMIYAGPDSYTDVKADDAQRLEKSGRFKDEESGRWAFYI